MVTLTETQKRLVQARARLWEGEGRFASWARRARRDDAAAAFGRLLQEAEWTPAGQLNDGTRTRLLALAASLAPNSHLSRRLWHADPAGFDRRLRTLLREDDPLPARLSAFLSVPGAGALTASQLLCAGAPRSYPLVTKVGLRRLSPTPAQWRAARAAASARWGEAPADAPSSVARLLSLFVIYEAARDAANADTYPDLDDLLRGELPPLPAPMPLAEVREGAAAYETTPPAPSLTETTLLAGLEETASAQGLSFPPRFLRAYYVALKTKPFAVLSGVSGSGKTRLAELVADFFTGGAPAQSLLLAVRPDWTDSVPLLGYWDALSRSYQTPPFLRLLRAAARPEATRRAFFVCLDEMNLARPEHYLAEYLSALETRARRIVLGHDAPDAHLSSTLFLTGTVNSDETTHVFSRKVLDRAFVLDLDAPPPLSDFAGGRAKGDIGEAHTPDTPQARQDVLLGSRLAGVGRARERLSQIAPGLSERVVAVLSAMNDALAPRRLHFAFRVRDESLLFCAHAFDAQSGQGLFLPDTADNLTLALDFVTCQKVLPRVNGVWEHLESVLRALSAVAHTEGLTQAAAKLARMREQGEATGYVRCAE